MPLPTPVEWYKQSTMPLRLQQYGTSRVQCLFPVQVEGNTSSTSLQPMPSPDQLLSASKFQQHSILLFLLLSLMLNNISSSQLYIYSHLLCNQGFLQLPIPSTYSPRSILQSSVNIYVFSTDIIMHISLQNLSTSVSRFSIPLQLVLENSTKLSAKNNPVIVSVPIWTLRLVFCNLIYIPAIQREHKSGDKQHPCFTP